MKREYKLPSELRNYLIHLFEQHQARRRCGQSFPHESD
jgi:hypothetical protein